MTAGRPAGDGLCGLGPAVVQLVAGVFGALLVAFCAAPVGAASVQAPPEPPGYRMEDFRAPTPAGLAGATVLTTRAAEALWRARGAVFVDVLPRPPRPVGLPAGTLWRDTPHASIPGAVWLPNVGFGALNDETKAYFRDGLKAATQGDDTRRLVFFCQRQCWMSWNAAKRALAAGYTNVAWYPDGTDGWREAGLSLDPAEPWK